MKYFFLFLTLIGFAFSPVQATKPFSSQEIVVSPPPKMQIVQIQTSAVCGMCKETLNKSLLSLKGIKKVEMNEETKILSVTFNPKWIQADGIRKAISEVGYDADSVPANPKAYEKLHACCKKDAQH